MTEKKTPSTKRARPSRRGKTLTSGEKAEAIALWRAGDVTLDELAERFHRDRSTFVRLFNAEGVAKGELREEHEKKVAAAVESAALSDATITAQRIRETKERHYKIAVGISSAAHRLVAKAVQENRPIATEMANLKALKLEMEIQTMARDQEYTLLGLNDVTAGDDVPMPDLVIQELTADEIKSMHKQMEESDELNGIGNLGELEEVA